MNEIKTNDIENKVKQILSQFININQEELKMEDDLAVDLGMTSFDMVFMVGEIETEYDIEIDMETLKEIKTIADVCVYIGEFNT